jgi:hypothetical protein
MIDETAKPPQILAIGFIKDAEAYVESARQLERLPGGSSRFRQPTYFLLCQAMELALKAYLGLRECPTERFAMRLATT